MMPPPPNRIHNASKWETSGSEGFVEVNKPRSLPLGRAVQGGTPLLPYHSQSRKLKHWKRRLSQDYRIQA